MDAVVLLLRGINVGGRNRLPMADLRALVGELGLVDAATYLQSGNVVGTPTGDRPAADVAAELAVAVADRLAADRGLTVPVIARTGGEWADVLAQNPFRADEDDPTRLHVTFLARAPDPDAVAALASVADPARADRYAAVGRHLYLHLPDGYADTPLQNAVLEKRLGTTATTRNWRTVVALGALAGSADHRGAPVASARGD